MVKNIGCTPRLILILQFTPTRATACKSSCGSKVVLWVEIRLLACVVLWSSCGRKSSCASKIVLWVENRLVVESRLGGTGLFGNRLVSSCGRLVVESRLVGRKSSCGRKSSWWHGSFWKSSCGSLGSPVIFLPPQNQP